MKLKSGVFSDNFLIVITIEFFASQLKLLCFSMAESFSIIPEKTLGKVTDTSVFGVLGKSLSMN